MSSKEKVIITVACMVFLISCPALAKGPVATGPVMCVNLANGIAGDPDVKSVTSTIILASGSNKSYCQVDILYVHQFGPEHQHSRRPTAQFAGWR